MTSACAGVSMENGLKEHRTFECVQLFNPDLHWTTARAMLRCPLVMPVDGMDECARGVFLRAKRAKVSFSPGPFTAAHKMEAPKLLAKNFSPSRPKSLGLTTLISSANATACSFI